MNYLAYRTTGLAIKTIASLSRAKINLHGPDNIPEGNHIFVINHFTRMETFIMPYYIFKQTGVPVWSLAAAELFKGALGGYLEKVGAVSTQHPDRDRLIVKSLLTGEADWIIFPEGRMVKSKQIVEKGRFMISYAGGKHPPHTGAATLALRTEFYRQRLRYMAATHPTEADRLLELFRIDSLSEVSPQSTYIIPVNLTYYPIRVEENLLSDLATSLVEDLPERYLEEIMIEGTMLLSGVDIDIRFGKPQRVDSLLDIPLIRKDIERKDAFGFDDILPSRRAMRKVALDIMQSYMAAIYGMTTINYDHLFASLLKLMPNRWIEEIDLRRRVFLAATQDLEAQGVFTHELLQANQTHLLTESGPKHYEDFRALALERDLILSRDQHIKRNPAKFTSVFDFHRIRIDNPIAVMANAIEPLQQLQRRLRRLAWQPPFWVKRRVAKNLMAKAEREFQEDYQQFFIERESKPKHIGQPFLLKGSSRQLGVVLSHGYMAAPMEVRKLADYLAQRGLWVYAPRLKGHGTAPEDLAQRKYMDWVQSVEEGYAAISSICKRVVVGGFSTGAGLALDLATRIDRLAGVFAVSAPLRLQDLAARFVSAVDVWNRLMDIFPGEGAKKEYVVNNPENPHINYLRNPISGVRELERLMDRLEPRLPDIKVPALVLQSDGDPVVHPKGSKRIFDQLGSEDKQYLLFNFDRHGILLGEGSERVHRVIWHFIRDLM